MSDRVDATVEYLSNTLSAQELERVFRKLENRFYTHVEEPIFSISNANKEELRRRSKALDDGEVAVFPAFDSLRDLATKHGYSFD